MADPWQSHPQGWVVRFNTGVEKRIRAVGKPTRGDRWEGKWFISDPKKMGLGWLWKFQEQVNYSELIRTSTFLICGHVSILLSPVRVRELDGSKSMRRIWSPQHQLLLRMATRTPWRPQWQHPGNGRNPNDMAWKWIIYIYIHTKHIDVNMSIQLHRAAIHNYIMINSNLIIEA